MLKRHPAVYILSSYNRSTLYIGVTGNLIARIQRHKAGEQRDSFSNRYNTKILVYHESFRTMDLAIAREKQLKRWRREKKEALINQKNPDWKDLFGKLIGAAQ